MINSHFLDTLICHRPFDATIIYDTLQNTDSKSLILPKSVSLSIKKEKNTPT